MGWTRTKWNFGAVQQKILLLYFGLCWGLGYVGAFIRQTGVVQSFDLTLTAEEELAKIRADYLQPTDGWWTSLNTPPSRIRRGAEAEGGGSLRSERSHYENVHFSIRDVTSDDVTGKAARDAAAEIKVAGIRPPLSTHIPNIF
ncbi:hypothetical protein EVAR_62866_1 [Eumeta japonica]|uniref:Uncharacterized protein n=1 Tax=Eumeta variegata TaxID=151549 RepID=A0A4C1Z370_EUMVA|nr:hypothetical protein EVAR_62866_1 [Eumeta japonica]